MYTYDEFLDRKKLFLCQVEFAKTYLPCVTRRPPSLGTVPAPNERCATSLRHDRLSYNEVPECGECEGVDLERKSCRPSICIYG